MKSRVKTHYDHTPVNLQFFHEKPYSQFWMHTKTSTARKTKNNHTHILMLAINIWLPIPPVFLTSSGTFPVYNFFFRRVCLYKYEGAGYGGYIINPNLIHNQIHGRGVGQSHQSPLTLNEGGYRGIRGVEGNTLG